MRTQSLTVVKGLDRTATYLFEHHCQTIVVERVRTERCKLCVLVATYLALTSPSTTMIVLIQVVAERIALLHIAGEVDLAGGGTAMASVRHRAPSICICLTAIMVL